MDCRDKPGNDERGDGEFSPLPWEEVGAQRWVMRS